MIATNVLDPVMTYNSNIMYSKPGITNAIARLCWWIGNFFYFQSFLIRFDGFIY